MPGEGRWDHKPIRAEMQLNCRNNLGW